MTRRKNVSSKDVAKACGVSQATVSYVLCNNQNVKIKPETRQLVIETAKRLNYHTNCAARSMRLNKAISIGIVTSKTMSNYLFMNVLDGIKESLTSKNYSMILCFSRNVNVNDMEYVRYYHSKMIDGVIFAFADISKEEKDYMAEHKIPYVSIHANIGDESPYQVRTNIEKAISDAISYLLHNGISKIGYLGHTAGNINAVRYKGFCGAMQSHGIALQDKFILRIPLKDNGLEIDIKKLFEKMPEKPGAVFCDSINTGFSILRYTNITGINIPQELSVIAIGTSPFSQKVYPALSCIEAPLYKMGLCGSDMLLSLLDENAFNVTDNVIMDWKFVQRESC